MIGAAAGDIIGSIYEWENIKTKDFDLFAPEAFFTDDTVLTVALAETILDNDDYARVMKNYYEKYPNAGYGGSFHEWARNPDSVPYDSWGNGSAMRTSAVAYAFDNLQEVMSKAKYYAAFTHNHPEGIKGAQATAAAIFLALKGISKGEIKSFIVNQFGYDLTKTLAEIRPEYEFDVSCQGTVPQAITAFLEADDFEDAIRNAVSLGGDSDTLACITGSIAEAFYGGVPQEISTFVFSKLDDSLRKVIIRFYAKHIDFQRN